MGKFPAFLTIIVFFKILFAAQLPPPNLPAQVSFDSSTGSLRLVYNAEKIFEGKLKAFTPRLSPLEGVKFGLSKKVKEGKKVEQILSFKALGKKGVVPAGKIVLILNATLTASEEAFPAETRGPWQDRFPCVRNSVGLSRSLRNNAVYDRHWDWVLIGPGGGATKITPKGQAENRRQFLWQSSGEEITLTFRPRFYQKYKGIERFEPWTYKVWKGSVTGYCTWWAYRHGFSQKILDKILDVWTEKHIPDYGYIYFQLDDCYQLGNGSSPRGWLTWNSKFPGGPMYTIRRIRRAGMKPGIWVHRVHRPNDPDVKEIAKVHPEWFVQKANGELLLYRGFYALNTHKKEAVENMIRPIFRALKEQGWEYVKIDGAGDLFHAYRQVPEFFKRIGSTPGDTERVWDSVAREELGRDVYILSCWGVWPSLNFVGLIDGCRLWHDGFGRGEFEWYNSWNGVVWRNDPDHCDILPRYGSKARTNVFGVQGAPVETINRPAVCSFAGGVLMVSDRVEVYEDERNLEGMKRSAPVLFTVPGQLYDYHQRRPGQYGIRHMGGETEWWLLEIDKPFDHWSVLARFNWSQPKLNWELPQLKAKRVRFSDIGLREDKEYLVFEFWKQRFLGKFRTFFTAPAMGRDVGLRVFAIREAREYPWVIGTTRHISVGGVSLLEERWNPKEGILSGKSAVVAEDPYVLTVYVPQPYRVKGIYVEGEKADLQVKEKIAKVSFKSMTTRDLSWKIFFSR